VTSEYVLELGSLGGLRIGDILAESSRGKDRLWLRRVFNAASPFLYNPRATFNLSGDLFADLQDLAGRRQIAQLNPRTVKFIDRDSRPSFKNLFGKLLLRMTIPAYNKVIETYWRNQDERAALLARVTKP
jgi:hypothetical protein